MTICIELEIQDEIFDGTEIVAFDDFVWSRTQNNFFRGIRKPVGATSGLTGIVDFFEILEGLAIQFGPFVDFVSANAGSASSLTDILLERAVAYGVGGDPGNWLVGTHTPDGWGGANGVRLRECPEFQVTETAETFQAGGSGQVSNTLFADGQAGSVLFPSGMRCFISGGANGANVVAFYIQPLTAPRTIGELALAGQPPPQFA